MVVGSTKGRSAHNVSSSPLPVHHRHSGHGSNRLNCSQPLGNNQKVKCLPPFRLADTSKWLQNWPLVVAVWSRSHGHHDAPGGGGDCFWIASSSWLALTPLVQMVAFRTCLGARAQVVPCSSAVSSWQVSRAHCLYKHIHSIQI